MFLFFLILNSIYFKKINTSNIKLSYPIINSNSSIRDKKCLKFLNKNVDVYLSGKGLVLFAEKNTIIILHSSSYLSIYSNLKSINVIKGDILRDVNKKIGISKEYLIFCVKKVDKNESLQEIDFEKILMKRN